MGENSGMVTEADAGMKEKRMQGSSLASGTL